ncbi:MAG: hypothetical protein ABI824_05120 [Acidobacteriota bacterium]
MKLRLAGPFVMALVILGLGSIALQSAGKKPKPEIHFQTSDRCMACHNSLTTPSGEDISFGMNWRATMMANSARDPYWQAGVRRETLDHPEASKAIQDECAICHMPMARYQAHSEGRSAEVFSHLPFDMDKPEDRLAADGVSCSLCHQITPEKLGTRESLVGGFVIDTSKPLGQRNEYGPYKIDTGHQQIMRSSSSGYQPTEGEHIRKSELCATCHTLITKPLGPKGEELGSTFPEQMPYQEWLHSDFKETKSCQACHMPVVTEPTPVTRVLGEPREGVSRHVFVGGNFFIQRILNRYRAELKVEALPQELETAAERTVRHLQNETARLSLSGLDLRASRLEADIDVENLGGHKLPTAYPSRRVWLHVKLKDRSGNTVFESGALQPDGSIRGNVNDADPLRYEPHYLRVTEPDQVQIYEGIMFNQAGSPTTGLLNALRYGKDNRLLPKGFDKRTADNEISVQGDALADSDFLGGGDRVHFSMATGNSQGPYTVEAELWYQPISYRWANNLKQYDAFEPKRFVGYYEAMSAGSGTMLAHSTASR